MNRVSEVVPPQLMEVSDEFAKMLEPEVVKGIVVRDFVETFFKRVLAEVGEGQVGLRAVYIARTKGLDVKIVDWNGPLKIAVSTMEEVLERGGEYTGKSVLVSRTGELDSLGNPEISMTEEYLRFATENSLGVDGVSPAVLVYDLSEAVHEDGTYRVIYPDEDTKKKSLVMVYPMDITGLRNAFNGDAKINHAE